MVNNSKVSNLASVCTQLQSLLYAACVHIIMIVIGHGFSLVVDENYVAALAAYAILSSLHHIPVSG